MRSKLTKRDINLVAPATVPKRWKSLTDEVREAVVDVLKANLKDDDPKTRQKAAEAIIRIDSVELAHEKLYAPRTEVTETRIEQLTEAEVQAELEQLRGQQRVLTGEAGTTASDGTGETE